MSRCSDCVHVYRYAAHDRYERVRTSRPEQASGAREARSPETAAQPDETSSWVGSDTQRDAGAGREQTLDNGKASQHAVLVTNVWTKAEMYGQVIIGLTIIIFSNKCHCCTGNSAVSFRFWGENVSTFEQEEYRSTAADARRSWRWQIMPDQSTFSGRKHFLTAPYAALRKRHEDTARACSYTTRPRLNTQISYFYK